MKLLSVVGARPNFMKIAPFIGAIASHNRNHPEFPIQHILVHSGQHYDPALSDRFFDELGIPAPDHHLGVGSGSHAYQVGKTMMEFEHVLLKERPDWVVVAGDVNAACACALTAKKHQFRVAHIESGLRSDDWAMPEEINRIVTDRLSDLLFTTCGFANTNLAREGLPSERVAFVGNIMIDTLDRFLKLAACRKIDEVLRDNRGPDTAASHRGTLEGRPFGVLTLHRPSNVDDRASLERYIDLMLELSNRLPIIFPVHPRTKGRLNDFGLWSRLLESSTIFVLEPLGYIDLLALTSNAQMVLTDSGGIQEECCILGTPCLTLRENTERPATLADFGGTNHLVGTDPAKIREAFDLAMATLRCPARPPLWDGHTAERMLTRLIDSC